LMRRQIARGDGPAVIPVGRRVLIDREDLLAWLDSRRQRPKLSVASERRDRTSGEDWVSV